MVDRMNQKSSMIYSLYKYVALKVPIQELRDLEEVFNNNVRIIRSSYIYIPVPSNISYVKIPTLIPKQIAEGEVPTIVVDWQNPDKLLDIESEMNLELHMTSGSIFNKIMDNMILSGFKTVEREGSIIYLSGQERNTTTKWSKGELHSKISRDRLTEAIMKGEDDETIKEILKSVVQCRFKKEGEIFWQKNEYLDSFASYERVNESRIKNYTRSFLEQRVSCLDKSSRFPFVEDFDKSKEFESWLEEIL